jgi:hypothetical protein
MYKSKTRAYRLAYQRAYIAKNREKILAYRRAYYQANAKRLARQQKLSNKRHPERLRATRRRYYLKHPELFLLLSARFRARAKGLPFNLRIEDVQIPVFCPVLGIRLKRHDLSAAPSIDRKIPRLGYVRGNVTVMSRRANLLKNNASASEIKALAAWIEKHELR